MEVAMTSTTQRSDFLAVDEDMEISSEAGRGQESDIEIFDLDEDAATNVGDDEMVDDNDNDQKDEVMDEEFGRENTVDMDDEIVFDEDVEITEVAEVPPPDKSLEISAVQDSSEKEVESALIVPNPPLSDEHVGTVKDVAVAEPAEPPTVSAHEDNEKSTEQPPPEGNTISGGDGAQADEKFDSSQPEKAKHDENEAESAIQPPSSETERAVAPEQNVEAKGETEGEPPVHANLPHEVKVIYKRNEMCLFAPSDPEDSRTYLLQDMALLHSPMPELFPACRTVLADSIVPTDELHLEIPDLRLRLSEKAARQPAATLSNVIDVYLALSYNDSSDEPGPLYLNLEVVPDFQSRLDSLHDLASDGQGFTSIIEPDDSSDEEEWVERDEEESNIKAEEASTLDTSAEANTDLSSQADLVKEELETKLVDQASSEAVKSDLDEVTHNGDRARSVQAGADGNHDKDNDDPANAAVAKAHSRDQDASDTSATVQEDHGSPRDDSQTSPKAEDSYHEEATEPLTGEDAHVHGDEFDFDLGPGNEEDDNWHQEDVEVQEHDQNTTSALEASETVEASNPAPAATGRSGLDESTTQAAQVNTHSPKQDLTVTPPHTTDFNEDQEKSLHEDEWQVLEEEVKPDNGVESSHSPKEQGHQHIPSADEKVDGRQEHLQDDDDIINFSEDDEAKELVSSSMSHKRSRSELSAQIDSVNEGNELKRVKT